MMYSPPTALLVRASLIGVLLLAGCAASPAQNTNPFAAPAAKRQYAPDRDYDLQNVRIQTRVDYPNRLIYGRTRNTLAPLRPGLTVLRFHHGAGVTVSGCSVNGAPASFRVDDEFVRIETAPLAANVPVVAEIAYTAGKRQGEGFGDGGGLHWLTPTPANPQKIGFWTQGETYFNREWAVTWDYPNDFASSETVTTVPKDWTVIGNGRFVSDTLDAGNKTHTVTWREKSPHATYLLSLVAAPMDTQTGTWNGLPLVYMVPRGKKNLIPDSFGDTPKMLEYFSRVTGTPYPWEKYAQNAVYEFNGGMENVSASTLTERELTDARAGYRDMASLNAHELAHQWFGDLVSCKTWGDSWLNESFATFFQTLYFENSRGKSAYERETAENAASYLRESLQYKRPLSTNLYADPEDMFDRHAYPKGSMVLHTLRKQIGDAAFFAGIKRYLSVNRNKPVETSDLIKAFTEATGTNMQPFFDQWVYKPGHPVLDVTYGYDDAAHEATIMVKQVQDTSDGTPIYTVNTTIGVSAGGKLTRTRVTLNAAENTFRVPSPIKPDAILLDADREFLREFVRDPYTSETENVALLQFAPCAPDRQNALNRLLANKPSDAALEKAVAALRADTARFPVFTDLDALAEGKHEALRPFWREQLRHLSMDRRAIASEALGTLSATPEDTATLRAQVNTTAPYAVVVASLRALAGWDAVANKDMVLRAARMGSLGEVIRSTALPLLAKSDPQAARRLADGFLKPTQPAPLQAVGLGTLGMVAQKNDGAARSLLLAALKGSEPSLVIAAARGIAAFGDKSLLPDLRAVQAAPPPGTGRFFLAALRTYIRQLEAG